jgi:hypothetical protein
MVCTHLRELYNLCEKNRLRLGGSDLIRIVCTQCNQEETCPSVLMEDYDAAHSEDPSKPHPHGRTEASESPKLVENIHSPPTPT